MKKLLIGIILALSFVDFNGCATRALLKDESGQPISQNEINARKSNKNFLLFTVGGGALSFGTSFFIGSLIDRSLANDSQTELWVTTGIGTVAGLIYFAHQGRVRDFNFAVDKVKEDRLKGVTARLSRERERREQIEKEKKRLIEERQRQEAERKKLLEELKKRKKNKNNDSQSKG